MPTSILRFVVIVAFVVAGVFLIAQFPDSSTSALPTTTPTSSPSESASPTAGGQQNNGGGQETTPPPIEGVKVAVYNGTTQTGLAADVAAMLVKKFGVKVNSAWILNAPSIPVDLTTIYYVSAVDKPIAQAMVSFFKKISDRPEVQRLPANTTVPAGVQVAVYLGTNYVNAT